MPTELVTSLTMPVSESSSVARSVSASLKLLKLLDELLRDMMLILQEATETLNS